MDKRKIVGCLICGSLVCHSIAHALNGEHVDFKPSYTPGLNSVLLSTGTGMTVMYGYAIAQDYSSTEIAIQDIKRPITSNSTEENILRKGSPDWPAT